MNILSVKKGNFTRLDKGFGMKFTPLVLGKIVAVDKIGDFNRIQRVLAALISGTQMKNYGTTARLQRKN